MPKENLKESLSGNKLDLSVSSMSVVPVKELVSEIEKTGRKLTSPVQKTTPSKKQIWQSAVTLTVGHSVTVSDCQWHWQSQRRVDVGNDVVGLLNENYRSGCLLSISPLTLTIEGFQQGWWQWTWVVSLSSMIIDAIEVSYSIYFYSWQYSDSVNLTIIEVAMTDVKQRNIMYVSRVFRSATPKRLMSQSPKLQVLFASAFSWFSDFFRIFGIHIF